MIETPKVSVPDDDAIRTAVMRLSRPHPSGGRVIERAAVIAAGADSAAMLAWITENDGQAEALAPPAAAAHGLHGVRAPAAGADARRPLRYVLPAPVLTGPGNAPRG